MRMDRHVLHVRRQIGELFMATVAKNGGQIRVAKAKAAQREREYVLEVQLIALLKRYVYGDEEGFLVREPAVLCAVCVLTFEAVFKC